MKKIICLLLAGMVCLSCTGRGLLSDSAVTESDSAPELVSFMKTDVPNDAPKFSEHIVPVYRDTPKPPDVKSHPRSEKYRTAIREAAKSGVDFAGHYSIATWGCGTSCTGIAIIDVKSGQVYHPENLQSTSNWNLANSDLTEDDIDSWTAMSYRPNSRLLIVMGRINDDVETPLGISYFTWQGNELNLIRFVPLSRN